MWNFLVFFFFFFQLNRPFAQLLPGFETAGASGDGRSVTCTWIALRTLPNGEKKSSFLLLGNTEIIMQVADRPSPDAPSLTQAIIVQMVCLWKETKNQLDKCPWGSMTFHTVDPRKNLKKTACACLAIDVKQVTFIPFSLAGKNFWLKMKSVVIFGQLSRGTLCVFGLFFVCFFL